MSSIDRLCDFLGIAHPSNHVTCIGYGKKKPTCGNLVAQSSRAHAETVLFKIERDLGKGRRAALSDLEEVAELLLCKRWHQGQSVEKAGNWKRELRCWPSSFEESSIQTDQPSSSRSGVKNSLDSEEQLQRKYTKLRRAHVSLQNDLGSLQVDFDRLQSEHQDLQDDHEELQSRHELLEVEHATLEDSLQSLGEMSDETIVEEVKRRLSGIRNPEIAGTLTNFLAIMLGFSRDPEAEDNTENDDVETENGEEDADDGDEDTDDDGEDYEDSEQEQDEDDSLISAPQARMNTSTSRRRRNTSTNERQSHSECSICLQPYEDDSTDHWECRQCQNRVHQECFNTWKRSLPRTAAVRCIYCRHSV